MKRRRRRKPIPDGRWITVRGRCARVPDVAIRDVTITYTNDTGARWPLDIQAIRDAIDDVKRGWLRSLRFSTLAA